MRAIEDRFSREAIAGSRMGSHPNLVAVYDLVTGPDETLYLILEYVSGGTLAERIRADGSLPLTDTLRLTADIARGLQAAHDAGLVHRDIKPANIFLAADGRAQVGDFGIAQIDDVSARTQATVSHPGTPLYMSPEQTATTGYLRPTADQYSLGLVLFEILTGKVYKRLGKQEIAARLAPFPRPVAALIERLVAEDPEDRYLDMARVLAAVQAIASATETDAGLDTRSYQPESPSTVLDTSSSGFSSGPPVQFSLPYEAQTSAVPHASTSPLGSPPPPPIALPPQRRMNRRSALLALGGVVVAGAAGGGYLLLGRGATGTESGTPQSPDVAAGSPVGSPAGSD
ncbi:MAG: serine/threonine-protein kinase, partial [Rhodanobacteraceae bacterium]